MESAFYPVGTTRSGNRCHPHDGGAGAREVEKDASQEALVVLFICFFPRSFPHKVTHNNQSQNTNCQGDGQVLTLAGVLS